MSVGLACVRVYACMRACALAPLSIRDSPTGATDELLQEDRAIRRLKAYLEIICRFCVLVVIPVSACVLVDSRCIGMWTHYWNVCESSEGDDNGMDRSRTQPAYTIPLAVDVVVEVRVVLLLMREAAACLSN